MELYVDLFACDLKGVKDKINYFKDLGITYIHFMPLFKTRNGRNDGGYAISSYTEIEPALGSMEEFEELVDLLRNENIATCVDFILNHTAKEHEWARRALEGDSKYQDMYIMFDSREIPDKFEENIVDAFPDVAPGNFTYYDEIKKWVFTTFYEFQWDLNYKNPYVLNKMIENLLFIVNRGVDSIRMDAIRHIWKELGTDCSGLPQIFDIVDIMKTVLHIVAPGVILKGEAVSSYDSVSEYLGTGYKGCQMMYNVSLMAGFWHAIAKANAQYLENYLGKSTKTPSGTCWVNYVRCHDDVGFILEEKVTDELGLNFENQVESLVDFFKGDIPQSFSRGELYGTGLKKLYTRISGTLASMCGLEKALEQEDTFQTELAVRRILLLFSVLLSSKGMPIIYSGDEIGILNDYSYKENPEKAGDSRWIHRSKMDWNKVKMINVSNSIESRIYKGLKQLILIRKQNKAFSSDAELEVLKTGNDCVLGYVRRNSESSWIILENFSAQRQKINLSGLDEKIITDKYINILNGESYSPADVCGTEMEPYQYLWLQKASE
jgi:glycosidase